MKFKRLHGKQIIHTIQEAELIGPKRMTDIMIILPASGNTMAKLANDIIDTPATMAAKSHLRNESPLVIAPSTNDGLGANAQNIGKLLNRTNHYFVPFRQDNPITKPRSPVFVKIGFYSFYMSKIKYFSDCLLWGGSYIRKERIVRLKNILLLRLPKDIFLLKNYEISDII